MTSPRPRHRLSREEIGILMSFATRPHRFTEEMVRRLEEGVTYAEILEFGEEVGLPQSTVSRLFADGQRDSGRGADNLSAGRARSFRRALLMVVTVYVVAAVVLTALSGRGIGFAVTLVLIGLVMRAAIVRLSPG